MLKITVLCLLFTVTSGSGQTNKAIESTTQSDKGIIYFSYDNGMTWRNTSTGIAQKVSIGLGGIAISANVLAIATKEYGVYFYDHKNSIWEQSAADEQMIKSNIGSLFLFKKGIFVGTQYGGIFYSNNKGKTWATKNLGLRNLQGSFKPSVEIIK